MNIILSLKHKIALFYLYVTAFVLQDSWCWQNKSLEFTVVDADVADLEFVQSGYILKCSLSHSITLV